jgi:hypothetical protein
MAAAGGLQDALDVYRAAGVTTFSADNGAARWRASEIDPATGRQRGCTVCHGDDLRKPGRHERTGKPIEPMSPAVNPRRYTDVAFIGKWFLRNCKVTYGRACTAQEKGDFLSFLQNQ